MAESEEKLSTTPDVIYQHPLAYLLGLEGIALLRAFAGEHDRDFVLARFDEIRRLLDSGAWGEGVHATSMSTQEGYAQWAASYDEPGNALLEMEQPVVWDVLDSVPVGVALDAACGTGRHAARLVSLGHKVIGVDATSAMLEIARKRCPMRSSKRANSPICRLRTTPSILSSAGWQ
jgi:hypothetical protein